MPFVRDVRLTTTLFGPVSLMDGEKTGLGKIAAQWLKPTVTVDTEFLGTHDIAFWGVAKPIPKEVAILVVVGLFLLLKRIF